MFRRDLALTLASGAALVAGLVFLDALAVLATPRAVALGVVAGVAIEAAFLAGTPVVEWWERPWVPPASALVLVAGTALATTRVGPVAVAAACWGLVTYVVVLAATLVASRLDAA